MNGPGMGFFEGVPIDMHHCGLRRFGGEIVNKYALDALQKRRRGTVVVQGFGRFLRTAQG
jgi:hypothetical protein